MHFPEYSAGGLGPRIEHCWGYVSVFENTPKKFILKSIFPLKVATILLLVVQGRVKLEHSNHIVKVGAKATC